MIVFKKNFGETTMTTHIDLLKYSNQFIEAVNKYAQGDPFAEHNIDYAAMSKELDQIEQSPNKELQEEIDRVKQDFNEVIQSLGKPKPHSSDDWFRHYTFEERQLADKVQNLSLATVNLKSVIDAIDDELAGLRNKEAEQFAAKEREVKIQQQKATQGRTPFNQQDASFIIKDSINEIKSIAKKLRTAPANVSFIFYNNGNIGVTSSNVSLANMIRRSIVTSLTMALKQYLINAKKYFSSETVVINISV
jgi:hypothetical protein